MLILAEGITTWPNIIAALVIISLVAAFLIYMLFLNAYNMKMEKKIRDEIDPNEPRISSNAMRLLDAKSFEFNRRLTDEAFSIATLRNEKPIRVTTDDVKAALKKISNLS